MIILCNSIKAHSFLYLKRKIFYKDISKNNIIIIDPKKANSLIEMLINLDLAKKVSSKQIGARHLMKTIEFIYIQILRKVAYIY